MTNDKKKVQKMMVERAIKSISDEVETIKGELKSGRMRFDKRRIKKRLESVAKNAIAAVENEVTGALVLGMERVGDRFIPVTKPKPTPSSLVFVADDILVGLAAAFTLALIGGFVMEGINILEDWLEEADESDIAAAEGDVRRQAGDARDTLDGVIETLDLKIGADMLDARGATEQYNGMIDKKRNDLVRRKHNKHPFLSKGRIRSLIEPYLPYFYF